MSASNAVAVLTSAATALSVKQTRGHCEELQMLFICVLAKTELTVNASGSEIRAD